MKKNYSIDVHYDVVLSTHVVAESKEEAIGKAIEKLTPEDLNLGDVIDETGVVTNVEVVEDEEYPVEATEEPTPTDEKPAVNPISNGIYGAVCTSPEDVKALYEFLKIILGEK